MKAMKKTRILLLCLSSLFFTSCEKIFMDDPVSNDPVSTFEYLWNKVDQQYAFFDLKGVDWDSVHEVYRPMVTEDMEEEALFDICAAMLNTLRDGHTNLISSFNVSRNDTVYYKMVAEKNINTDIVLLHYLTLGYHSTGGFSHNSISNGQVAYLRFATFENAIDDATLLYPTDYYKNCQGMILDLRQNGGGLVNNVKKLLSIFDNHGQMLYQTQIKSGPGHDEFTEMATVNADTICLLEEPYTKPVAVLIDRGSYSATSFFSVCTQAYDNIQLFGDYSGGGLGLPNGGELPNGWTYRFSITRTIAIDGGNYENGVPPDVRVILDPECTAQGIDNVIETAADWILSKK